MSTLGELVADGVLTFNDGYRTKRDEHAETGFRILRAGDVRYGEIQPTGPDFVDLQYAGAIGEKVARAGDVVLTTKGTVGRVAHVRQLDEPVVYSPQVCYFRSRTPSVLHQPFLGYWLQGSEFTSQSGYLMGASDMAPYISLRDLASTTITLPQLAVQQAIAEVLGALDDKIAANRRVALSAGELAALLFRRRQADETRSATYEAVADISGGGTPSTKVPEYWGGHILWVTPTDVTALPAPYLDRTDRMITREGFDACASGLHPVGSILMTSRATIGAFALAKLPLAVNQGFIVVNAKNPAHQWWLFHEMQSRVGEYVAHANGATFLELSRGQFKSMEVEWPTEESVFEQFAAEVESLHDRAYRAIAGSRHLAHVRDTLLPHLMSGRITVRQAQALAEEVL